MKILDVLPWKCHISTVVAVMVFFTLPVWMTDERAMPFSSGILCVAAVATKATAAVVRGRCGRALPF